VHDQKIQKHNVLLFLQKNAAETVVDGGKTKKDDEKEDREKKEVAITPRHGDEESSDVQHEDDFEEATATDNESRGHDGDEVRSDAEDDNVNEEPMVSEEVSIPKFSLKQF